MPVTYQQESLGNQAVIYLHYFLQGHDWYITELDVLDQVTQAFGLVKLDGYEPELGYINISELRSVGAELDMHWQARTLDDVMTQIA